jgi:hypothetical protein
MTALDGSVQRYHDSDNEDLDLRWHLPGQQWTKGKCNHVHLLFQNCCLVCTQRNSQN